MRGAAKLKVGVGLALGAAITVAGVVMFAGSRAGADPNDAAQVVQGKAAYAERRAP